MVGDSEEGGRHRAPLVVVGRWARGRVAGARESRYHDEYVWGHSEGASGGQVQRATWKTVTLNPKFPIPNQNLLVNYCCEGCKKDKDNEWVVFSVR